MQEKRLWLEKTLVIFSNLGCNQLVICSKEIDSEDRETFKLLISKVKIICLVSDCMEE